MFVNVSPRFWHGVESHRRGRRPFRAKIKDATCRVRGVQLRVLPIVASDACREFRPDAPSVKVFVDRSAEADAVHSGEADAEVDGGVKGKAVDLLLDAIPSIRSSDRYVRSAFAVPRRVCRDEGGGNKSRHDKLFNQLGLLSTQ